MKPRTRCGWALTLAVGCFAGIAQADDLIELPGRVTGGFVDAHGEAILLVTDDEQRASELVRLDGGEIQSAIDLPPKRVGRSLTVLTDGRILLGSQDATTMHDRTQHYDIVEIRGNELETSWNWNNGDAFPGVDSGSEGFHVIFSWDGRAWGMGGGTSFSFGETGSRDLTTRNERFDVGGELADIGKWTIFSPGFVYLDSAGPVVVAPWNKGAYIVHFADNASPVVTPILFDDGVEEYRFLWQWEERILWAETSLYWKGYELPDLGVSGMEEEPIWVLDKSVGAPHAERGVIQLTMRNGSYRVEHAWRDPVTLVEERHASDWYPGETPFVYVVPGNGVFVSANGRHAVAVERRRAGGITTSYGRPMDLRPVAPAPPVEADRDAEAAADREFIGKLEW